MRGGYKIIDLHNTNFIKDTGQTVKGIYEDIENSYRKPLLISNFVLDGVEKSDRFITVYSSDNSFVGMLSASENGDVLNITITNEDLVTISSTN